MEETQTTTSGESTEVTSTEPTSTTTETVTSEETVADTTQDTSNDSTEAETEEAKTEEAPVQKQDWEKSYKELQSEFTKKTQELSQLKKQQEQANAVVEQSGQIKQSVIDRVAQQIAFEELSAYRNAIFELDTETQQEVNNLLNAYQQSNDRRYLDRAKEYYGSNFVGAIEAQKVQRTNQIANELEAKRQEYTTKRRQEFESGLKENAPVSYSYYDKDSAYYSPELANAIATSPSMDVAEIETAVKNIEEKVIAKYKANLAKLEAAQNGAKGLNLPQNKTTVTTQPASSLAEITDQRELDAMVDKLLK